jgi:small-conductance mechanosensitive channel
MAAIAVRTRMANVFAGYILLRNRVLRLRDPVQIGRVSGRVARITTGQRLGDGSRASVSNSNLLSGPLIHRTAGERLQRDP